MAHRNEEERSKYFIICDSEWGDKITMGIPTVKNTIQEACEVATGLARSGIGALVITPSGGVIHYR